MAERISDIKSELEKYEITEIDKFIEKYKTDTRKGVVNIVNSAKNKLIKYNEELIRINKMQEFERKYNDYKFICGIDEVGRGPLAGPVMAGAVILPKDCDILYLNDSKQLSEQMRDKLYDEIKSKAIASATALVSHEIIDEVDILRATFKAMRTAINKLDVKPDLLLVDAVNIPEVNIKQVGIVKGDAKSVSIAAASIIAKVERDRLMCDYDKMYPEYGFASNKGYGSKQHIEAIKKYGPCPIHRRTFIKNFIKKA